MARTYELDRLKRFSELVVVSMPNAAGPLASLQTDLLTAIAQIDSLKSARTVVRDLLEWTQDVGGPALAELDHRLAEAGLPTLSLMRSSENSQFIAILKRGSIDSEEEYRLVDLRLLDTASSLSDSDRRLADRLLNAFKK
jgi:hypothetical protein